MQKIPCLLINSFGEKDIEKLHDLFELLEPITFSHVVIGDLFMIPGTKVINKYFTVKGYPSITPIICKKESENQIIELITFFPVPSQVVQEEKKNDYVYPCKVR